MDNTPVLHARLNALRSREVANSLLQTKPLYAVVLAAVLDDPQMVDQLVDAAPSVFSWKTVDRHKVTLDNDNTEWDAVEVAVFLNSMSFLARFRKRGGRIRGRLPGLVKLAADNYAWDVAEWLVSDPINEAEVIESVAAGLFTPFAVLPESAESAWKQGLESTNGARLVALLDRVDCYSDGECPVDLSDEDERPVVLRLEPAVATTLVDRYRYGTSPETADDFFELFWDAFGQTIESTEVWFGIFLKSPALADHARAVVRRYSSLLEKQVKDPAFLTNLMDMGLYQPRMSLIDGVLCWNWFVGVIGPTPNPKSSPSSDSH